MTSDPLWYKDAVIYEAHVRAFQDSNGDGIGDFKGLTSRLDYIQDLGVNTIWLLPFYPSPGKDDGYDIADYHEIHPSYGTREDFKVFIEEAHRRNLRVITELVINHTSDQHPWFQAARQAEAGSPKREFYVWSDTPDKYAGTRIIFTDTESSNWTWDPIAKAYYWHRFFSHQPDLNFDNPDVEKAVIKTMRFWLDQGVDGLRLDAIPYLIERDGTSNENLRETHDVVKRIRKVIDEHYEDRMLLGEANMWPEDVRDYFADGDECHVAYHFPLMPRMYMAIALEDRYPIAEIIDQTPDIPANCQWAIFLRNHDELTLEMVTSRERDYMYQMYATEPRARLNLGIRRRLAPLMENDIERIKLMNSLLLSMPGSPIIYYGDEIGMGDNFYLGDRNGVRTPMQWSPDRNAGFSRADPERLYLPPIMDPVYGFQAVNVEAQARDRSSLLNWMKRLLEVRKTSQAFGRGALRFIRPGNRKVLCYVREYGEDTILCVVNLARSAQPVELNLAEFKGMVPVELLGRTPFPAIGDLPYLLTLQGHGFYWFRLSRTDAAPAWSDDRSQREEAPVLVLVDGWHSLFPDRVAKWRESLAVKLRGQFETRVLPSYLPAQRWYGDKGSRPTRATMVEAIEWNAGGVSALLGLFDVENNQTTIRYFVPLMLAFEDGDDVRWTRLQTSAIARVRQQATLGVISDALADERFVRSLVDAIGKEAETRSAHGTVHCIRTSAYDTLNPPDTPPGTELAIQTPHAQGSNTALKIGERMFLKAYRRLQPGVNPELEIGRYLTEVAHFQNAVPIAGAIEFRGDDGTVYTLALLQGFVANQGDGWDYTVNHLTRFLEDRKVGVPMPADVHAVYLAMIRTLGQRTAQLHLALAADTADPAFGHEDLTRDDLLALRSRMLAEAAVTFDLLTKPEQLPEGARADAAKLLDARAAVLARINQLTEQLPHTFKSRHHGDFHLGQVLIQRNDFILVDFEGEPARTQEERRQKQSPLRDVAGLLRSLAYARHAAQLRCALDASEDCSRWTGLLHDWERQARAEFLSGYDEVAKGVVYDELQSVLPLIEAFELEKALYEVRYELGNRPDWAVIPISSLIGRHE